MKEYYSKRAQEYEKIYFRDDPVRQTELNMMKKDISKYLTDSNVLEVACGTGYWTEIISKAAGSVTAFDFSPEVIEIAKSKNLDAEFLIDDAYEMKKIKGEFDGGCANFWFSHIPKNRIKDFLTVFHNKLSPGAVIFMADNNYMEGIGGEFIQKTGDTNTYKRRILSDGSSYEIIKNYYSKDELKNIFKDFAIKINITLAKCYWWILYEI